MNNTKIDIKVHYKKSDFEKGLERVLNEVGANLSEPFVHNGSTNDEEVTVTRRAVIKGTNSDKIKVDYSRATSIYDSLNFDQKEETSEWVFLDYNNMNNGYGFRLNSNHKMMEYCEADFSVNDLAPRYSGILTTKHVTTKDGEYHTPKITKEKFLNELNKILQENISYKKTKKCENRRSRLHDSSWM